jgi:hypothetical protein
MCGVYRASAQGCHMVHFLNECAILMLKIVTHFWKPLGTMIDQGGNDLVPQFSDGSSAAADAVVSCDA